MILNGLLNDWLCYKLICFTFINGSITLSFNCIIDYVLWLMQRIYWKWCKYRCFKFSKNFQMVEDHSAQCYKFTCFTSINGSITLSINYIIDYVLWLMRGIYWKWYKCRCFKFSKNFQMVEDHSAQLKTFCII